MATEPLTGARYPTQQDAPLGGLQIGYAVQDLAPYTVPRFSTAAQRDAAYVNFVNNGGTLGDGMRCIVAGYEMGRLSGIWRYMQGILVVPDAAARNALPGTYSGLTIYQVDIGKVLTRSGGVWNSTVSEIWDNGSTNGSNTMAGTSWQGTTFANVPTDLGSPITVPAEGFQRSLDIIATASVAGDMYMRVAAVVGGTTTYYPNSNGVRSIASAGQEQPVTVVGTLYATGATPVVVSVQARASAAGSGSIYVASCRVLSS